MEIQFSPMPEVRSLILEHLAGDYPDDLPEVTKQVSAKLSDEQAQSIRMYGLWRYVQDVNRGKRNPKPPRLMGSPESAPLAPVGGEKKPAVGRSRVAGVRSWWSDVLNGQYPVGGEYKTLRTLTVEDLLSVAARNRENAERNVATAARLEALAEAVQAAGVVTVGDLDEKTAQERWLSAA